MGRKKQKTFQLKPFCYYCDREFDNDKVLIQHQKQKHFKCLECSRKLDTATGLVVHVVQVHKESLTKVPNALLGRDNPEVIVHGMEGVPEQMVQEKMMKLRESLGADETKKQQQQQKAIWQNTFPALSYEHYFQQSMDPSMRAAFFPALNSNTNFMMPNAQLNPIHFPVLPSTSGAPVATGMPSGSPTQIPSNIPNFFMPGSLSAPSTNLIPGTDGTGDAARMASTTSNQSTVGIPPPGVSLIGPKPEVPQPVMQPNATMVSMEGEISWEERRAAALGLRRLNSTGWG